MRRRVEDHSSPRSCTLPASSISTKERSLLATRPPLSRGRNAPTKVPTCWSATTLPVSSRERIRPAKPSHTRKPASGHQTGPSPWPVTTSLNCSAFIVPLSCTSRPHLDKRDTATVATTHHHIGCLVGRQAGSGASRGGTSPRSPGRRYGVLCDHSTVHSTPCSCHLRRLSRAAP